MEGNNNKEVLRTDSNKIDALPNSLLCKILSFLDMKEVMATSIVSRRWRYLWESVSVLNFDQCMWDKKYRKKDNEVSSKRFMSFVDRVLLLRDGSEINKLYIICANDDSDRLDTWLTLAARKKFQEVHLELYAKESMEVPNLIFTSAITVFKIVVDVKSPIGCRIGIPSSISSSPQLTALILDNVTLPEGNSSGELILSCPVLENLTLREFLVTHLTAVIISTPQLKTLIIENPISDDSICDYDFFDIRIWTPNLTSLEWNCYWGFDMYRELNFYSMNLSKLLDAKMECFTDTYILVQSLEALSCATTIYIHFEISRGISEKLTSQYLNLRHLTLHQSASRLCFWFVLKLLENAPCLETLILDVDECYEDEEIPFVAEDFEEEEISFMISHLKSVEIRGEFVEDAHVKIVEFLKVLLKKAIVLEVLIIEMAWERSLKNVKAFGKQIHSLPRASSSLTIIFV